MTTHEFSNICHRNHRSSRLLNPRNSPFFSCASRSCQRSGFRGVRFCDLLQMLYGARSFVKQLRLVKKV